MTPGEVTAAHRAAVERLKAGRRNEYRAYSENERLRAKILDGTELPAMSVYAPEYLDAATADQWWDDRIRERNSSFHGMPETPLLMTLAVLLRAGDEDGARSVLKPARQLGPSVQWTVYENIRLWHRHVDAAKFGTDRAVNRLLAEWERLRLPTEDPASQEQPKRRRRFWETAETEARA